MVTAAETPETLDIFVSWGGATLILFALISGVAGFAVWVGKWMDKRMALIATQLDERTQPIQSGYTNHGNSLTDISTRQKAIGQELGDLRSVTEANHELLAVKIDNVNERLDAHAASNMHDRRQRNLPVDQKRRRTDTEE